MSWSVLCLFQKTKKTVGRSTSLPIACNQSKSSQLYKIDPYIGVGWGGYRGKGVQGGEGTEV
jgi:hypothetical protein